MLEQAATASCHFISNSPFTHQTNAQCYVGQLNTLRINR